ncbi:hypothetical protein [Clostridium sp.]|jgi:hypothetical protein|uniref:hypothetical protein n=1 Tax=Clostridium sp. TaxID=1506 RepID=UPI002FDD01C6
MQGLLSNELLSNSKLFGSNTSGKQDFSNYLKNINTIYRPIGFTSEGLWVYDTVTGVAEVINPSGTVIKTVSYPVSSAYIPTTVTPSYICWVNSNYAVITDHNGTIILNSYSEGNTINNITINEAMQQIYSYINGPVTNIRNFTGTIIKQYINTYYSSLLAFIPCKNGVVGLAVGQSIFCDNTSFYTFTNSNNNLLTNVLSI